MSVRFTEHGGGVRFEVKVVPGASRDRIVGPLGEALKVAVSKPPQGGAANAAVVKLIAAALLVPESAVQIVRGHASPRKQVCVAGLGAAEINRRLSSGDNFGDPRATGGGGSPHHSNS